MKDQGKRKEQLTEELAELRQRIAELETSEAERKRAEEALERRMAELSALNAMATIVNQSLDVDEILNRAMDEALRLMGVEAAAMMLFDEEAGELVMAAHRGISDEFVRAASRLKPDEGLSGQVVQTGEAAVMADLADYPWALKAYLEKERIQSAVVVPLIGSTGVMGTMNLASASLEYFDAAGLELLVALGRQIATGVEKARLSQETFRAVAENASDGILITAGQGAQVYANKRAAEITGYSVAELLKTTIKDLVHPDEFGKITERYRKRLEGKPVPRQYETIIIRKDGESVPIELTAAKTVWQGQPADMVIIRDITERRRAEEALRESEQRLSTTLRSIGDAVIATDAQGLVTLMNPVAEDLTGWDEAEAVRQPLEDVFNIVNEQTGERAENPVARVLREGIVVGLANHTVLIAKDGTKRPIADSGAPMRDTEGNILGTVMVFRDITERKRAEEALAQRVEELERFHRLAVGRELRMIELKRQINELSEQLGKEPPYDLSLLE